MIEPQSDTGENDAPIRPVYLQDERRGIPVTGFSRHEDAEYRCLRHYSDLHNVKENESLNVNA